MNRMAAPGHLIWCENFSRSMYPVEQFIHVSGWDDMAWHPARTTHPAGPLKFPPAARTGLIVKHFAARRNVHMLTDSFSGRVISG